MDIKNQFWCDVICNDETTVDDTAPADVYLYGVIGAGFGGANANNIIEEFKPSIGNVSKMNIHVASPGGDLFEGVKLRSFFANHPANKTVFIDGSVASAATIAIALPGVRTVMAKGSEYVIHNPYAIKSYAGEADEWEHAIAPEALKVAIRLRKVKGQMLDIYQERSGLPLDTLNDMVDVETSFTPQEAIDSGFADEIGGNRAIAAFMPDSMGVMFKHEYAGFSSSVVLPLAAIEAEPVVLDFPTDVEHYSPQVQNISLPTLEELPLHHPSLAASVAVSRSKAGIDTQEGED